MSGREYVGCLTVVAILAIASGASAGAVLVAVASKFIGLAVLIAVGFVIFLAVSRNG